MDDLNIGGLEGAPLHGIWPGTVVDRNDPLKLGRIKVSVPGILEDDSAWALPRAGGAPQFGCVNVPPIGADVFVQFLGGRIEKPIWEPGPHGLEEGFFEHVDPDTHVFGIGPFRLLIDNREGQRELHAYVVRDVAGTEERVIELEVNFETNSARLFATTALQLEAIGLVDINANGDVQVKGRKILPRDATIG